MQLKEIPEVKNKVLLAAVLVACFIPSAVAYSSYKNAQRAPIDENTAVKISITDVNDKSYTLSRSKDAEAEDMIKYFLSLRSGAQSIVALPDSLLGVKPFKVTVSSPFREDTGEYYFSSDPDTCYMRLADGTTYKISEDDAKEFITSKYAESLYVSAAMPTLTLSNTYSVTPDTAIWQYKNYTGSFVDADVSAQVLDEDESYDLDGGIGLSFDIEPDYCSVSITSQDGAPLFEGNLENVSQFTTQTSTKVGVKVTARWFEDPSRSFCGDLSYVFETMVTAPAEFYLGMTTVDAGKFTAVTALNVAKPDSIKFSADLGADVTPVFYKVDETTAAALIPVPIDLPAGIYELTFTYGGTTQKANLTVTNDGLKTSTYEVPESVISTYRTKENLDKFAAVVEELGKTGSAERYFSGSFLEGVTGYMTLTRGFGRDVYLNGSASVAYRNNGVDYKGEAGQDVVACNKGKVVYASSECAYAGKMVVIDHGYGLKTWYYNMGDISVSVGDTVEKGAKVGTTGQSGFTGQSGVHIAMSVGTTFVSPYDTWADSQKAAKVILAKIDE